MKAEFVDISSGDVRRAGSQAPSSIGTNIDLSDVRSEEGRLLIQFEFTITYLPEGSHIRLGGRAAFSGPEIDEAAEEWAKTRKIGGKSGEFILNSINFGSVSNAVVLARVFNLMPPLMLPAITLAAPEQAPKTRSKKK